MRDGCVGLSESLLKWCSRGWLLAVVCATGNAMAEGDLAIGIDAFPSPVVVDRPLQLQIEVSNLGPDPVAGISVEIELPDALMLVSVSPDSVSCQTGSPVVCQLIDTTLEPTAAISFAIATQTLQPIGLSVPVRVTSAGSDPASDNNTASVSFSVVEFAHSADLRLTMLPVPAFTGGASEVTVAVTNDGPALAPDVSLSVSIPALRMASYVSVASDQGQCRSALDGCSGFQCIDALNRPVSIDCELGGLGAGSTAFVRLVSNVDLAAGETLRAFASASSGETADPEPANNSAAFESTVLDAQDITDTQWTGPGGCFIATALFGTPWAAEVQTLRKFRDRYLLGHAPGRALVRAYYRYSPALAARLAANEPLRRMLAATLGTGLRLVKPLVFGILLLAVGLLAVSIRRRRRPGRFLPSL